MLFVIEPRCAHRDSRVLFPFPVQVPEQDALLIIYEPEEPAGRSSGNIDEPVGEAQIARGAARDAAMEAGVRQKWHEAIGQRPSAQLSLRPQARQDLPRCRPLIAEFEGVVSDRWCLAEPGERAMEGHW